LFGGVDGALLNDVVGLDEDGERASGGVVDEDGGCGMADDDEAACCAR